MNFVPKTEIESRINKFQRQMKKSEMDGALLVLNADVFYFTGTVQNSVLWVPSEGEPVFMVRRSVERGRRESPLAHIVPIKSPRDVPEVLSRFGYTQSGRIGLELDVLPVNTFFFYQKLFPDTKFVDVTPTVKDIRAIKSAYEIEYLREACRTVDNAFREIPMLLHEGMTELELASQFEAVLRRNGHHGYNVMRAFNQGPSIGVTCAGESGGTPSYMDGPLGGPGPTPAFPHGAGWRTIKRNEPIIIDYACTVNGYTVDQTRVFCIGELPDYMVKAFEDAVLIQEEILKLIKPGTPCEEPYLLALELAEKMGYKDSFMGRPGDQVRFIGHGVGLELDENPVFAKGIKTPIMPGMTFALEPKFVFAEGAVGTENTFLMTENGPERLTITPEVITYLK